MQTAAAIADPDSLESPPPAAAPRWLSAVGMPLDPAHACEVWAEIASGRWAIAAAVDSDGERHALVSAVPVWAAPDWSLLTPREVGVVALAAAGEGQFAIAIGLGMSPSAVSALLRSACLKLGLAPLHRLLRAYRAAAACDCTSWPRALRVRTAGPATGGLVVSYSLGCLAVLTRAERHVARLAARGLSNRDIATERRTSPHTVARQMSALLRKLEVNGTRAALATVVELNV